MNSYPPELLVQLAPVMFVAGLDPPQSGRTDSFSTLVARLRDALTTQRKVGIWQPERNKTFQVVLVDKVCAICCYIFVYNCLTHAPIRTYASRLERCLRQMSSLTRRRTLRFLPSLLPRHFILMDSSPPYGFASIPRSFPRSSCFSPGCTSILHHNPRVRRWIYRRAIRIERWRSAHTIVLLRPRLQGGNVVQASVG
jgi:hypothetical protein